MLKKIILKLSRSLIKLFLPIIYKILVKLKVNRRVVNFLEEESYFSNKNHNFSNIIQRLLGKDKILALDVGAQGGFNSDNFFPSKYNIFFDEILVEPIKSEAEKIHSKKYVINKGLWSKKEKKKIYILENRLGSSSMYEPDVDKFSLHNIKKAEFDNYTVTRIQEVNCDTINNLLKELKIKNLDYLKIDTQGSELEILHGLGDYCPLLIKIEAHIFSMYKDVPSWHKLLNLLYERNYVTIDFKGIGRHVTRIPVEADMIFIPNFNSKIGREKILNQKKKFVSLMLMFGQINILKLIMNKLNIQDREISNFQDLYFN